jgi:predicted NACHT family NTPase
MASIRGVAGAGKTTLLQKLDFQLAARRAQDALPGPDRVSD